MFALIGALSIVPTMRFLKWGRAARRNAAVPSEAEWRSTRQLVFIESHLLILIVLAAVLMARGIG